MLVKNIKKFQGDKMFKNLDKLQIIIFLFLQ